MLALLFRIDSLLKRFQEYADKCRGIRVAILAGRQHSVSVGNRLKRHPEGRNSSPLLST